MERLCRLDEKGKSRGLVQAFRPSGKTDEKALCVLVEQEMGSLRKSARYGAARRIAHALDVLLWDSRNSLGLSEAGRTALMAVWAESTSYLAHQAGFPRDTAHVLARIADQSDVRFEGVRLCNVGYADPGSAVVLKRLDLVKAKSSIRISSDSHTGHEYAAAIAAVRGGLGAEEKDAQLGDSPMGLLDRSRGESERIGDLEGILFEKAAVVEVYSRSGQWKLAEKAAEEADAFAANVGTAMPLAVAAANLKVGKSFVRIARHAHSPGMMKRGVARLNDAHQGFGRLGSKTYMKMSAAALKKIGAPDGAPGIDQDGSSR